MADLADLIARVEAATGPNFELERDIFEALAMPDEWFGSKVVGFFRMGAGYGFNTEDGFSHHDCLKAPAYTASLDAALGLAERCFPTASLLDISGSWELNDKEVWPAWSIRWYPHGYPRDGKSWHAQIGSAPTPALALCLAILKAHSQAGTTEPQGVVPGDNPNV